VELDEGTKLNSLTLNCQGVGIINVSSLIENYFDFDNARLLKLQGNCNLDLSVVDRMSILGDKCDLYGRYSIYNNSELADISYRLKKTLVKYFGNIDSETNRASFVYKTSVLTKQYLSFDKEIYGVKYSVSTNPSDNEFYPFDSIDFS